MLDDLSLQLSYLGKNAPGRNTERIPSQDIYKLWLDVQKIECKAIVQGISGIFRTKVIMIVMVVKIQRVACFWGKKKASKSLYLKKNRRQCLCCLHCRTLLWVTAMVFCVPENLLLGQKELQFSFCLFASALPPLIPGDNITLWGTSGKIYARTVCENNVISVMFVLVDWIEEFKFIRLLITYSSEASI